ncbi:MAG: hypothetical protein ABI227_03350 [Rhodanobacter sp.]
MVIKKNTPGWSGVKAKLADTDRSGLMALLQDLYAASKDNQTFLHARLSLGDDVLAPYKAAITQWINPPDPRKPLSVAKAKKAISDYKKAVGRSEGLAELTVFYCEQVFEFLSVCGIDDDGFYDAWVRMFEQALKYMQALPATQRAPLMVRLVALRHQAKITGWGGVSDDFNDHWLAAGLSE